MPLCHMEANMTIQTQNIVVSNPDSWTKIWAKLTTTIPHGWGVYQRMGCWNGDTSVPLDTYERLLDAFLYSPATQLFSWWFEIQVPGGERVFSSQMSLLQNVASKEFQKFLDSIFIFLYKYNIYIYIICVFIYIFYIYKKDLHVNSMCESGELNNFILQESETKTKNLFWQCNWDFWGFSASPTPVRMKRKATRR